MGRKKSKVLPSWQILDEDGKAISASNFSIKKHCKKQGDKK